MPLVIAWMVSGGHGDESNLAEFLVVLQWSLLIRESGEAGNGPTGKRGKARKRKETVRAKGPWPGSSGTGNILHGWLSSSIDVMYLLLTTITT